MRATIITDASWHPESKAGGWACWIRYDDKRLVKAAAGFKSKMKTAEHAEECAVINALAVCIQEAQQPLTSVLIQTDCLNVVKRLTRQHIASILTKFSVPERVTLRHVKGHTKGSDKANHWCNNWCDAAAKKKMREEHAKC